MSLLLAILSVLPPAYTLGPPSWGSDSPALVSRLTWVRLFAELSCVPCFSDPTPLRPFAHPRLRRRSQPPHSHRAGPRLPGSRRGHGLLGGGNSHRSRLGASLAGACGPVPAR